MSMTARSCVALLFCAALSACSGGSDNKPAPPPAGSAPSPAPAPPPPALASGPFTVSGTVATVRGVSGAYITAYDTAGKSCGTAISGSDGRYTLAGTCAFPVVLFADTPAGNDTERRPGVRGEGTEAYAFISSLSTGDQAFSVDLTPISTAVTVLALGRRAAPLQANSKALLTDVRRDAALAKVKEALSPFLGAMSAPDVNLLSGSFAGDAPLRRLASLVSFSFDRVETAKQNLFKFFIATEHRPIVLVSNDGRPIEDASFDPGLGIKPADVNISRFSSGITVAAELAVLMQGSPLRSLPLDTCFLHNASKSVDAVYDLPVALPSGFNAPLSDVRVLRVNTFTRRS